MDQQSEIQRLLKMRIENRHLLIEIKKTVKQQVQKAIRAHATRYGSYDLQCPSENYGRGKKIIFTYLDDDIRDQYGIEIFGLNYEEGLFKIYINLVGPKIDVLSQYLQSSYWELVISLRSDCKIRSYVADDEFQDWWFISCDAINFSTPADELRAVAEALSEFVKPSEDHRGV